MSTALFVRNRRWMVSACLALLACGVVAAGAQAPKTTLPLDPAARARRQHHPGLRRLVQERRRQLQPAARLLQPQLQGSARHSGRPEQPRSSRAPPIRASRRTSRSAASGACSSIKVPKDFGTKIDHLDDRRQRRDAVDSVHARTRAIPISPYEELGMHNEPPVLAFSEGGAEVHRPADRGGRDLHRHGEPAGRDHRSGSRIRRRPARPRARPGPRLRRRWRPSRSTSFAGPARSRSTRPASR